MAWHDEVWPKQRANAKRRRLSPEEREYRETVRRNKTRAAVTASNARIAADRAERAKQRAANDEIIARNAADEPKGTLPDLSQLENYYRLRYKAT